MIGQPDLHAMTGFLLAEDDAVKTYLSGIQVPDAKNVMQNVSVYFRYPESERRITYPFITLDLINVERAWELNTSDWYPPKGTQIFEDPNTGQEIRRGQYWPSVTPEVGTPGSGDEGDAPLAWNYRQFLPHRLTYQVDVRSRHALHDRYLQSIFYSDILPCEPFWIGVDADHTWRRIQLLDFMDYDTVETTEADKRIFRKIWTIAMHAELPQDFLVHSAQVLRVHADVYAMPVEEREAVTHLWNSPHPAAQDHFTEPPPGS